MKKLIKPGRLAAMAILLVLLLAIYTYFLYQVQIVEGTEYYNRSSAITKETRVVTAARGNILDRYGRLLISNKECYNLVIDSTKLFANEDPNEVILELIEMVEGFGDTYTDDLPITTEPPFEYTEMSDIQRTMLEAYFQDKASDFKEAKISASPTAVELMSYMRTRYGISNEYSAEQMRKIAGLRYSINVRYAVNTGEYVFVQDASMKLISSIMENKLNGIEVKRSFTRQYHTENAAHILGYVGLMTTEEYEKYSLLNYANDAMVGKDGAENAFEKYLHGEDGEVEEMKNSSGTILSTFYTKEPVPGNNIYLTLDINLQEAVERVLNAGVNALIRTRENEKMEQMAKGMWEFEDGKYEITGAAAVVVNVKTGEPLAIASWPTYDVTTIIENYSELMKADNTPLFNRALMGAYAPGSTFKPCTAIAALTSDKVDLDTSTEIKCEGVFTKYAADGYAPECWIWSQGFTHPKENVTTALRDSCNYFFYTVGHDLGIDTLGEYARAFGLGVSTGIELVETKGNMSNAANHQDYAGSEWRIGDTLQAAIGQSDSVFTPLQLAEYCATVANGGTRHSASILKSVRSYDYSDKIYERKADVLSTVESPQYNWDAVHEGMKQVLNEPMNETNYLNFYDCAVTVAGKTGTAQKGEGIKNDALFICYAPYEDPEIAVAVVVERGHAGASVGFIARQIVDVYLNIRSFSNTSEQEMALLK